jgi:hypothetical protein
MAYKLISCDNGTSIVVLREPVCTFKLTDVFRTDFCGQTRALAITLSLCDWKEV